MAIQSSLHKDIHETKVPPNTGLQCAECRLPITENSCKCSKARKLFWHTDCVNKYVIVDNFY